MGSTAGLAVRPTCGGKRPPGGDAEVTRLVPHAHQRRTRTRSQPMTTTDDTLIIHRSPLPDVELPDGALTPYILRRAKDLADKPALVDGPTGRTLTYGELAEAVASV